MSVYNNNSVTEVVCILVCGYLLCHILLKEVSICLRAIKYSK